MAFDYFTLQALAAELSQRLKGRRILRAGTEARVLALACGREGFLCARLGRGGSVCFRRGGWPGEVKQEGALRYLPGALVEALWAERRERVLHLRLERKGKDGAASYGRLIFELVPPYIQAVLIREKTGQVLGRWAGQTPPASAARTLPGRPYLPLPGERLLPGEDEFSSFYQAVQPLEGTLGKALVALLAGMDSTAADELLHRAGMDAAVDARALDEADLRRLWQVAAQLYKEPAGREGYVWRVGERCLFSALEPTHFQGEVARLSSVNQAVFRALDQGRRAAGAQREERRIRRQLCGRLRALERKKQALQQDLAAAEGAEEMERKGHVLMAQLRQVGAGAAAVELVDIYDISGCSRMCIELDPGKTPAENGTQYLKRARKYRRRRQILPARLEALERERARFEEALSGLDQGKLMSDEVQQWLEERGLARASKKKAPRRDSAHPRRYRTTSGWSVWAGRSNTENDVLTHRLAAAADFWFHASGYPGSHVILRREGRKEEPSRQTLEEAAGVAAYWSKGRTARKVPVVCTLVKYVSRPRGGAPGEALLRREKTLVVKPALLPEEQHESKRNIT